MYISLGKCCKLYSGCIRHTMFHVCDAHNIFSLKTYTFTISNSYPIIWDKNVLGIRCFTDSNQRFNFTVKFTTL